jgi:hypothetical protein
MTIQRVQARQKGVTGYINCMRGTWLGNPFPLNKYPLERSLFLFEKYFEYRYSIDITLRNYLHTLADRSKTETILLGCTCKPENPCHTDIIKTKLEKIVIGS